MATATATALIQRKVREYEIFLNDRLRADLQRAWSERDRLFSEIAEYERLRMTLDTLGDLYKQRQQTSTDDPLQTQIDLGCSFFVQAECPVNDRIFISMGFGLFCELTYDEAKQFIEKKVPHLHEQEVELSKKIAHIKANIKLVLQALKEIQSIDEKKAPASTVPFWMFSCWFLQRITFLLTVVFLCHSSSRLKHIIRRKRTLFVVRCVEDWIQGDDIHIDGWAMRERERGPLISGVFYKTYREERKRRAWPFESRTPLYRYAICFQMFAIRQFTSRILPRSSCVLSSRSQSDTPSQLTHTNPSDLEGKSPVDSSLWATSETNGLIQYLSSRIKAAGPITVADFMRESLSNPKYVRYSSFLHLWRRTNRKQVVVLMWFFFQGYYGRHEQLGRKDDAIATPEIRQMYAEVWNEILDPRGCHT